MIASAIRVVLIHSGKKWLCASPDNTDRVFGGRSMYEALGKMAAELKGRLGIDADSHWDDDHRTILNPLAESDVIVREALTACPSNRTRLASQMLDQLNARSADR
jgi:hypothetical protein